MLPPEWATASGKRLSIGDFTSEFMQAWSGLAGHCLKLECWQTYQEQPSNKSLDIYYSGDVESATKLLAQEAEGDRPIYDDAKSRNVDFVRIRLMTLPLTSYLKYEPINYRIRDEMGETIEIVLLDPRISLPNNDFFDFLVFDNTVALVHDYGTDGFQTGGWLVEESDVVRRLEEIALSLRRKSVPLAEFLGTANV
jgi:hypothetical protein